MKSKPTRINEIQSYSPHSSFLLSKFTLYFLNELFFYPTPNNFNYFYCVGFLLGLLLSFQFVTGILVACYYIPKVGIAFTSVDYLIRDIVVG